jgi:hypothetical protein
MPRKNLIELFPDIWKNLDGSGFTGRFLGVVDFQLNTARDKIEAYLKSRDVANIADKFLILLSDLAGHEWDSDRSKNWNRDRIRNAIRRHNYKGSFARLQDVTREAGADRIKVQDNASILMILGKQGRLSRPDAYFVSSNFYHDGAYKLTIWDSEAPKIDQPFLSRELDKTLPAGTVWFVESVLELDTALELNWEKSGALLFPSTNALLGSLGNGILGKEIYLSFEPQAGAQISYSEVDRIQLSNDADPTVDNSGIQSTGYYEISAITGASFTGDSGLPADLLDNIPANIDNITKFLTDEQAALQPKPQKTTI